MNNPINLIKTEAYEYISRTNQLDGHAMRRLLEEPHLFREGIATHLGVMRYPKWLGGITEILHINKTSVYLGYNPDNLDNPAILSIHGTNEDILATKSLLEHLLKTKLELKR